MKIQRTIKFLLLVILLFGFVKNSTGDSCLPQNRRVDWTKAGLLPGTEFHVDHWFYINDYAGTDYEKIMSALADAVSQPGNTVIYFESPAYYIDQTIEITPTLKTKPGNIIFLGNLSPDTLTTLFFQGVDEDEDCFYVRGWYQNDTAMILTDFNKGERTILYDESADIDLERGDWIKFSEADFDDNYDKSNSEYIGQITQIESFSSGELTLKDEASKDYSADNNMYLQEFRPVTSIGFENFKVERDNNTKGYGVTFNFDRAVNCWMRGVESYKCTGYHVKIDRSAHLEISGSFFHVATNYDSDEGTGYGVVLGDATTNCRVENNVFQETRHAMLVGTGANANVFGYNYSREATWDFSNLNPGDIRLHGRYPYANLFEGNSVDRIYGDETHGDNGPYNTFLRNKVRDDDLTLYNSDYSNVFTNYIKGDHTFVDEPGWAYQLIHPEAKKSKNVLRDNDCPDISYYHNSKPSFFINHGDIFPPYETNSQNSKIPADVRWEEYKADKIISPTYYNPPNFAPLVNIPVDDVEIEEDSPVYAINLADVFKDHNDSNSDINESIIYLSNGSLFTYEIANDFLFILPALNQFGSCEVFLQGESEGMTVNDTFMVVINPVNDAPFGADTTITVLEDSLYYFQQRDFAYSDIEADQMRAIKIISLPDKGRLKLDITDITIDQGIENFTAFTFMAEPDSFDNNYTQFSYKLVDEYNAVSDSTYFTTIHVENVDDPPFVASPLPDIQVKEDSAGIFADLRHTFSDIDSPDSLITKTIHHDSKNTLSGLTIFEDSLKISLLENAFGRDTIIVKAVSNSLFTLDSFLVEVLPVNDAPFGSDTIITIPEDSVYYFNQNDFPYHDIENDEFLGIQITALPDKGKIRYDTDSLLTHQIITDVNRLNFQPEKDSIGDHYTNFAFKILDSHSAESDSTYQMTINVLEIDDPPGVTKPVANMVFFEDAPDTLIDLTNTFTDPDNDDNEINISLFKNTNISLLDIVCGDTLMLVHLKKNQNGQADIILQAESNTLFAYDTFNISVLPVNDVPSNFSLLQPVDNDSVNIQTKDSLKFSWARSLDPDSGETVAYDLIIGEIHTIPGLTDTVFMLDLAIIESLLQDSDSTQFSTTWHVRALSGNDTTASHVKHSLLLLNNDVAIKGTEALLPATFQLHRNYPNPFNPMTTIPYSIPKPADVTITIYNAKGHQISKQKFQNQQAGTHYYLWHATNQPSGFYLYKMQAENYIKIRKCLLLK